MFLSNSILTKIRIYFLAALLLNLKGFAQTPAFQWVGGLGGNPNDNAGVVVYDNNGNVYSCGHFWGTGDFNPGPGVFTLTSVGANDNFITKLDANGNFIWAKQISGPLTQSCRAMEIDPSGNIYISGYFSGVTDFDPGPGTYTFSTAPPATGNLFVLKLDPNGNFIWAKRAGNGSIGSTDGLDLLLDPAGAVYVTGEYSDTQDFDPGPGIFNLTGSVGSNGYVLKLDLNGNFMWATSVPGWGVSAALDLSGNIYISGGFTATNDFDPGPGVFMLTPTYLNGSGANGDGYILKLTSAGNFVWVKQLSGTGRSQVDKIAIDCRGYLYGCGFFDVSFDADPGSGVALLTEQNLWNASFIVKLTTAGNFVWAKSFDNNTSDFTLDRLGDIYMTGYFDSAMDFDPGPGTFTLSSVGGDAFISKYTTDGNFNWAYKFGAGAFDNGSAIRVDTADNIYVTGEYDGTVDFNPAAPVSSITSHNSSVDIFVLKFSQTLAPINITSTNGQSFCGTGSATLNAVSTSSLNWYSTPTSITSIHSGTNFITPVLTTSTTYYVDRSSCTVGPRLAITVTVNPLPPVLAHSTKSLICRGDSATLTATGATSYTWNTFTGTSMVISPTVTTTYTVWGRDVNGCLNSSTLSIPYSSYIPNTDFYYLPVCANTSVGIDPSFETNFDYGGVFSSTGLTVDADKGKIDLSTVIPGNYIITYTVLANGCAGSKQSTLSVLGPNLSLSTGSAVPLGSIITLTANGGSSYTWTPALNCSTCATLTVSPSENTQYCVVSEMEGCMARSCVDIIVTCETNNDFSLPNAFTPNGDGNNDLFCLQGWNTCATHFRILIFNRWGEKVFESNNPDFCWDGVYKGNLLSADVFIYSVEATFKSHSAISRKGNITLTR